MGLVVFQPVEVLIAFATSLTFVRFFLLHAQGPFVGNRCLGVDNGEGSVSIVVQTLVVVTMLDYQ